MRGLNLPDFVFTTGHDLVDQLRAYRQKVGLTQDDIAWKLGFAATTVSRWERGVAVPDLRATGAIVDFLRRADAQTERRLLASILASRESRNLWEGRDIRYLGGSQQEYRESPEMRAVIGTSIRGYLTGHYRACLEDRALVASLYAREIASIEIYGGPALSVTSIPAPWPSPEMPPILRRSHRPHAPISSGAISSDGDHQLATARSRAQIAR